MMHYTTQVNKVCFNCSDTSDEIVMIKGKGAISIGIGEIEDFISWYKNKDLRLRIVSSIEKLSTEELREVNTFLVSNFSKINGNFQSGISCEHDEA